MRKLRVSSANFLAEFDCNSCKKIISFPFFVTIFGPPQVNFFISPPDDFDFEQVVLVTKSMSGSGSRGARIKGWPSAMKWLVWFSSKKFSQIYQEENVVFLKNILQDLLRNMNIFKACVDNDKLYYLLLLNMASVKYMKIQNYSIFTNP